MISRIDNSTIQRIFYRFCTQEPLKIKAIFRNGLVYVIMDATFNAYYKKSVLKLTKYTQF